MQDMEDRVFKLGEPLPFTLLVPKIVITRVDPDNIDELVKEYEAQRIRTTPRQVRCKHCGLVFRDREACSQHILEHYRQSDTFQSGETYARKRPATGTDEGVAQKKHAPPVKQAAQLKTDHVSQLNVDKAKDLATQNAQKARSDSRKRSLQKTPFTCTQCSATFSTEKSLLAHEAEVHNGSEMVAPGAEVGVMYKDARTVLMDTQTTAFPCHVCQKEFLTQVGLDRHVKTTHPQQTAAEKVKDSDGGIGEVDLNLSMEQTEEGGDEGDDDYESAMEQTSSDLPQRPGGLPRPVFKPGITFRGRGRGRGRGSRGGGLSRPDVQYSEQGVDQNEMEIPSAPQLQHACQECGQRFRVRNALEVHLRTHERYHQAKDSGNLAAVADLACEECKMVFLQPMAIQQHRVAAHGHGFDLKCTDCGAEFKKRSDLNEHRRQHFSSSGIYPCMDCGRKFTSAKSLFDHLIEVHKTDHVGAREKTLAATPGKGKGRGDDDTSDEDYVPGVDDDDDRPKRRKRGRGGAAAGRGRGRGRGSANTVTYMSQSTGAEASEFGGEELGSSPDFACRSTCDLCGLILTKPSNLIRHMKLIHKRTNFTATVETKGMPPFKIDVFDGRFTWGCCNEIFDDRNTFISHRRAAHVQGITGAPGPRRCEYCTLECKSHASYLVHAKTHMRSRVCRICQKEFHGGSMHDFESYHEHLRQHQLEGYCVLGLDWDEDWDAVSEASEDALSIFSESGVESEAELSDADDDDCGIIQSCPVCEKSFACMFRFGNHWKYHLKRRNLQTESLKTKPYSFKRPHRTWTCSDCGHRCYRRATLGMHRRHCRKRVFGDQNAVEKASLPPASEMMPAASLSVEKSPVKMRAHEGFEEKENSMDKQDHSMRKKKMPLFVERGYVVQWTMPAESKPAQFRCLVAGCEQTTTDFPSMLVHVDSHVEHPILKRDAKHAVNGEVKEEGSLRALAVQVGMSNRPTSGRYVCSQCNKRFRDRFTLDEHLKDHEFQRKHRCTTCRKRFWTAESLEKHVRKHDVNTFHCHECGRKFLNEEYLQKHLVSHELRGSLYQCEQCDLSFFGQKVLQAHFAEKHVGIRIYSCYVCAAIHSDRASLHQHMEIEHKLSSRCMLCKKTLHTPYDVMRHARRVHLTDGQTCNLCGKQFEKRSWLTMHLWRHTCTSGFQCRVCDRGFAQELECRQHVEVAHPTEAKASGVVIDTMMVYGSLGEKLPKDTKCFKCYVCCRRFGTKLMVRSHALLAHKRRHNHTCASCGRPFFSMRGLNAHIALRHPEILVAQQVMQAALQHQQQLNQQQAEAAAALDAAVTTGADQVTTERVHVPTADELWDASQDVIRSPSKRALAAATDAQAQAVDALLNPPSMDMSLADQAHAQLMELQHEEQLQAAAKQSDRSSPFF